jgi:hypothetical protein
MLSTSLKGKSGLIFFQIVRALKKIKFNTKVNKFAKKSLLTLFKTVISQKLLCLELQNKFNLIRNKLFEFIQFCLNRLLQYFLSFRFLKYNASFFRVAGSNI